VEFIFGLFKSSKIPALVDHSTPFFLLAEPVLPPAPIGHLSVALEHASLRLGIEILRPLVLPSRGYFFYWTPIGGRFSPAPIGPLL
jgi:hypothetical protein